MATKDLKPNKLTRADKVKGGKSKSILKSLVKRQHCNKNCQLFERCPFVSMALKYDTCYLNCAEYPTLKRLVGKLIEGDQTEFYEILDIIVSDIFRITITEDDSDIRSKKIVMDALEKYHNMKYGTKTKMEHSGKIDIELFKKYLEGEKET